MRARLVLSVCFLVVTCLLTSAAQAVTQYTITDLGTLGGNQSGAFGINNLGQVAGWARDASGSDRAFVWQHGTMTDIGTLGGSMARAYGINDAGEVVGLSATATGAAYAFLWDGASMTDLGHLGGDFSEAQGINNARQIVGLSRRTADGDVYAFLWQDGAIQDLGAVLGPSASRAMDINSLGHVVGTYAIGNAAQAFLWHDGTVTLLPHAPAGRSSADGMNDADLVVGYIGVSTNWRDAAVWEDGAVQDISPTPFDYTYWSWAYDANREGCIVGRTGTRYGTENRASFWEGGVYYDLNDLVLGAAGWQLTHAQAINDAGLIVGFGTSPDGQERAFLLTPIPEPSMLVLAAVGVLATLLRPRPRVTSWASWQAS